MGHKGFCYADTDFYKALSKEVGGGGGALLCLSMLVGGGAVGELAVCVV